MTTIAWDGRTLAADRLCTYSAGLSTVRKIRRSADGWLMGASGNVSACRAMLDWIEGGEKGKPPMPLTSDAWCDIMLISPEGQVFMFGSYGRFPVEDAFAAIGSGRNYALAAMALGLDARAAVELTSRFDPNTGSAVDVLTIAPVAAAEAIHAAA